MDELFPDTDQQGQEELAGVEGRFYAPTPIQDGSQVLLHDAYDVFEFQSASQTYSKLAELVEHAQHRLVTARALIRDLYWSFLKAAPEIAPVVPLTAAHELNRLIVEQIMNTVEWRQVRQAGTIGDALNAVLATVGVAGRALAALDQPTVDRINRLHEAEVGTDALFSQAEALEDLAAQASGDRAAQLFRQAEEARRRAEQQRLEQQRLEQELAAQTEQIEDATRRAGRRGLAEVEGQIDASNAAIRAFGGGYGPDAETMTTQDKIKLAAAVGRSQRLQQIAAICGRITRVALNVQYSKVQHPPDEITSITIGRDLGRILPAETGLLADPELEDVFWLRFAEGRLMQYDLIGNERQGQGPIIVALDSSGSMGADLGGATREVWSKAVTLALLAIARLQQRDMVVIHFDDRAAPVLHSFPLGRGTHTEVVACAETFLGRGTLYEPWMRAATQIASEAQYDRADVIVISDGEPNDIDELAWSAWQSQRQARGMRCYAVLLGADAGGAVLGRISDALLMLNNMQADMPVLETIFNV